MMIVPWLIFAAIALRLLSGAGYVYSVLKGRSQPNPVTWFFWALAPAIVFAALISEGSTGSVLWITFALGIGPIVVFVLSLYKAPWRAHFTPTTITCAILAIVGVILWRLTSNPLLAIVFSILVDIFASVPTLVKAYHKPRSEYPLPYLVSALSMVITVLTITPEGFISYLFPLYMLLINCLLFYVPYSRGISFQPQPLESTTTRHRIRPRR